MVEYKICTNKLCVDPMKPSTEEYFYKQKVRTEHKGTYYKLASWCKECAKGNSANWSNSNPNKRKEIQDKYNHTPVRKEMIAESNELRRKNGKYREWQRNNPDKVRNNYFKRMHKNHNISSDEKLACKEYFNYECAYCGMTETECKNRYNNQLHMDHFDHKGDNDLTNAVPACKSCNCSKGDKEIDDWYNGTKVFYTDEKLNKIIKWIHEDCYSFLKST